ncbi:hypothetical protein ACHAP5_002648 [Fusarium lateritium]
MDSPKERGSLGTDLPESRPDTQSGQQPVSPPEQPVLPAEELVLPPGPRPLPTPPGSRDTSQEPPTPRKSKNRRDAERIARYNGQKKADRRAKQVERIFAAGPLGWVPAENWDNPGIHLRQWAFLRDIDEDTHIENTHSEDDEPPKTKSLSKGKFVDAEFFENG